MTSRLTLIPFFLGIRLDALDNYENGVTLGSVPRDHRAGSHSLLYPRIAARLAFVVLCGISGANADNYPAVESKLAQLDRLVLHDIDDPAFNYGGFNAIIGVGFLGKRPSEIGTGHRSCDYASVPGEAVAAHDHDAQGEVQAEATEYARDIAERVKIGATELPARQQFSREAAASFARYVSMFTAAGDFRAIEDLLHSPLLVTFLLDSRESGYCARLAAGSIEDRIARSDELASYGIRRIEHADHDTASFKTFYLYRPWRMSERIKNEASDSSADASLARKLSDAAAVMELLNRGIRPPRPTLAPYSFRAPGRSSSEILSSEENRIPAEARYELQIDFPIDMLTLRRDFGGNRRPPEFTEDQWLALDHIVASCPPLTNAPDFYVIRIVTDGTKTHGRVVAKLGDDRRTGVMIHLSALDQIAKLEGKRSGKLRGRFEFLSAAVSAAGR